MASPSYSILHPVSQLLTNIVSGGIPSNNQLIASELCEQIPAPERSGTLLRESSRSFMGATGLDPRRSPGGARAVMGDTTRDSLTFKCEINSLADRIPMEDIEDSQYPMGEEERASLKLSRALLLHREQSCADLMFSLTEFPNNVTPTTKFDAAGAEPLTYIHNQLDIFRGDNHGMVCDTMVFGWDIMRALCRNPEMRGYAGTVGQGFSSGNNILNDDACITALKNIFQVDRILVGAARRETAIIGQASSEANIWNGETIGLYIMRGSDAVSQRSGSIKTMPVAALDIQYKPMIAGVWDDLDGIARNVWVEESNKFLKVDADKGRLIYNTLT